MFITRNSESDIYITVLYNLICNSELISHNSEFPAILNLGLSNLTFMFILKFIYFFPKV